MKWLYQHIHWHSNFLSTADIMSYIKSALFLTFIVFVFLNILSIGINFSHKSVVSPEADIYDLLPLLLSSFQNTNQPNLEWAVESKIINYEIILHGQLCIIIANLGLVCLLIWLLLWNQKISQRRRVSQTQTIRDVSQSHGITYCLLFSPFSVLNPNCIPFMVQWRFSVKAVLLHLHRSVKCSTILLCHSNSHNH